jgi:SOS-response transcriptional repressor LexA
MTRRRNQALWDQWRQRVERQRESGLSIAAFCRREGVSPASFHVWKRKLRTSAPSRWSRKAAAMQRPQDATVTKRPGRQSAPIRSITATRAANFLQLPVLGARSSPWIELTLVDGTIVRVPQQNLAALRTVLRVLRGVEDEALLGEVCHA